MNQDQIQNWSNTNLKDYLLFDSWKEEPAMCVLVGLDYLQHSEGIGLPLDWGVRSNLDINAYEEVISNMRRDVQRLRAFFINSSQTRESYTPSSYIDWALTKNFRPPWLDWAIEHKLYEPNQEVSQNKTGTVTLTTTYSTKWLEIQQAAIAEFFSPRHEVDAKKEEIVSWIIWMAGEAGIKAPENIAKAIFTIIKPENHSPKIRRAGPIKAQQP